MEGSDLPYSHRKFLLKSSAFCLHHNYFWYEQDDFYLQTKGVAMGAWLPPVYQHIYGPLGGEGSL